LHEVSANDENATKNEKIDLKVDWKNSRNPMTQIKKLKISIPTYVFLLSDVLSS